MLNKIILASQSKVRKEILDKHNIFCEVKPSFVDVTYHREEFIERPRKDGGYDKISTKKRPGTVAICAAIMNKYQVEAVPHLICGGFNKDETENALIDLAFLGIENVLALRGDNLREERNFTPEKNGNVITAALPRASLSTSSFISP